MPFSVKIMKNQVLHQAAQEQHDHNRHGQDCYVHHIWMIPSWVQHALSFLQTSVLLCGRWTEPDFYINMASSQRHRISSILV